MMTGAKKELRKTALTKRKDAHAAALASANAKAGSDGGGGVMSSLTKQLKLLLRDDWASDKILAGYVAMGSEINPAEILQEAHRAAMSLALPVTAALTDLSGEENAAMRFVGWQPGQKLLTGPHGALEPVSDTPAVLPDIVLVPLVGFDASGVRLGRGGGYYDRALAALRGQKPVIAVGLAYQAQFFDSLPSEQHDERLDAIGTPEEIYRVTVRER